jgi:hypothetical protein
MDVRGIYLDGVNKHLDLPGDYLAHWAPNSPCALGDVGRREDGDWQRTIRADESPLMDLGASGAGTSAPFKFTDGGKVELRAALKGSTDQGFEFIGNAEAGIKVSFEKERSLLVAAPNAAYDQLPNDMTVAEKMKEAFEDGDLNYGDQVIVGVYTASSFVILVAAQAGATADITTNAKISEGVINVAEVQGELGLVNQSSVGYDSSSKDVGPIVLAHRALEIHRKGIIHRHPVVSSAEYVAPEEDYDVVLPFAMEPTRK